MEKDMTTQTVPVEPTEEMLKAAADLNDRAWAGNYGICGAAPDEIWEVMLSAAPRTDDELARLDYASEAGIWTLTAPDGRQWQAASGLKCAIAEQRERVPAEAQLQRLNAALQEEDELERLERDIATNAALTSLGNNLHGGRSDKPGWFVLDTERVQTLQAEPIIRYLELRGLLERHPTQPDLVRVKGD